MKNALRALLIAPALLLLPETSAHGHGRQIHDWNWYGFYHPEWQDYLGTFRSPGVGGPPTYGPGYFGPRYRYYYGPPRRYHGPRHYYHPYHDRRYW
jgi:hypothetical protein